MNLAFMHELVLLAKERKKVKIILKRIAGPDDPICFSRCLRQKKTKKRKY